MEILKKLTVLTFLFILTNSFSQENYLGEGPFNQLIIRGVTLINGDGSPPRGPVDIVVENNIIVAIQVVGYPGVEIEEKNRPKLKKGGKELDASRYVFTSGIYRHAWSYWRKITREQIRHMFLSYGWLMELLQ
jgi:hypothetical protein